MASVISWLVTPDPLLNYTFLSKIFVALALISALLFVGQYVLQWEQITGFWLVPAPTLPALFYTLYLASVQRKGAREAKHD